ncbi:MAG: hypothetical protein ACPGLV_06330 [Bacteroidia bacterium]
MLRIFSKYWFIVILITVWNLLPAEVAAQCQACKSTVESNLVDGGSTGLGLNRGILYLLAMPYLMAMGIAAIWYYKFKNKKQLSNV